MSSIAFPLLACFIMGNSSTSVLDAKKVFSQVNSKSTSTCNFNSSIVTSYIEDTTDYYQILKNQETAIFSEFVNRIVSNSKEIDPVIGEYIDSIFWDLI
ncbi:MAG TPA: hypothetical protein PL041_04555 [Melioribacteraceae bacterium]|nr:hypothetical protein [Melioribacteraceae bacterium]